MCPTSAVEDSVNSSLANPKVFRESVTAHPFGAQFTDLKDLFFSEFGLVVRRSRTMLRPTLLVPISDIVQLSPQKEVVGPNARRHITGMEDTHSWRYAPITQPPSDSVGCEEALSYSEVTIPIGGERSSPKPTATSTKHLDPKPFRERGNHMTSIPSSRFP